MESSSGMQEYSYNIYSPSKFCLRKYSPQIYPHCWLSVEIQLATGICNKFFLPDTASHSSVQLRWLRTDIAWHNEQWTYVLYKWLNKPNQFHEGNGLLTEPIGTSVAEFSFAYYYVPHTRRVCPSALIRSCYMTFPFPLASLSHYQEVTHAGSLLYFSILHSVALYTLQYSPFHLPLTSLEYPLFLLRERLRLVGVVYE